jgi:cobalt-zinc-cadmium efflux system outer membrane protein
MTASRILLFVATGGLAAAPACAGAWASGEQPAPRPVAADLPTFQAPADPSAVPPEDEPPALVEEAAPLVLEDALALALMHNPELQAFSWESRAGEARALQARKIPNPELDLRYYSLGIPRGADDIDAARRRIFLRQDFELGGKRGRRSDLAGAERDLAGWDYEAKRLEVAAVVATRFAELLGAQHRVDAASRSVEFFEAMHERISTLVETGALRSLELHQSARQLALARVDLQTYESELGAARFRLAATWGSRSPLFTAAVGDLAAIGPLPGVEVVLQRAQEGPAVARWDSVLERAEAALALAQAERVPDLRAGAGIRWQDDIDQHDFIVDLEIALPIFDRKQGDILEGRYNKEKALAERKAAESATAEIVAELYFRLSAAEARAAALRDEVLPAARAAFEAFRLGFEQDASAPGNLFEARRDLTRAETGYAAALVDYHRALNALESLVGRPLLGVE